MANIIIKYTPKAKVPLVEFVRNIRDNNAHRVVEWGIPQGKEVWQRDDHTPPDRGDLVSVDSHRENPRGPRKSRSFSC